MSVEGGLPAHTMNADYSKEFKLHQKILYLSYDDTTLTIY